MKQNDDYYLRAMAALLSGKWTLSILHELRDDTRRFNEIQKAIPGATQKVLTETLRKLERDGMIKRHMHPTIPPQVEYTLTSFGLELLKIATIFTDWAEKHVEVIKQAHKAYDKRAS